MKSYIQHVVDKTKKNNYAWYIKNSNIPAFKTMLRDLNVGIGMTEHGHLGAACTTGLPFLITTFTVTAEQTVATVNKTHKNLSSSDVPPASFREAVIFWWGEYEISAYGPEREQTGVQLSGLHLFEL